MPSAQPTMQMIADRAGVSVMTVSRALKNNARLPPATRERIQKIASDLGYRPNPLVSVLMSQLRSARTPKVWPAIAFLSTLPDEIYTSGSTYNAQIYGGAIERATMLGYKLERFSLIEPGMTWHRMRDILHARGIPGVILPPLPDPTPDIDFDWSQFACATIDYGNLPALHRAVNDQFNIIRMAMRRLLDLGYRRIGLAIRHEDDRRVDDKWTGGFLSFSARLPASRRVPVFLWHYNDAQERGRWSGRAEPPPGFDRWVGRHRPDVILVLQPTVRAWLEKLGMRVPQDIGLVSLNLQRDQITFSGIDQHHASLGAAAVELVVEQIHHNERGVPARAKTVMFMGEWVDRSTTRPQPGGNLPAGAINAVASRIRSKARLNKRSE